LAFKDFIERFGDEVGGTFPESMQPARAFEAGLTNGALSER
jgi:hypothetical protein